MMIKCLNYMCNDGEYLDSVGSCAKNEVLDNRHLFIMLHML